MKVTEPSANQDMPEIVGQSRSWIRRVRRPVGEMQHLRAVGEQRRAPETEIEPPSVQLREEGNQVGMRLCSTGKPTTSEISLVSERVARDMRPFISRL